MCVCVCVCVCGTLLVKYIQWDHGEDATKFEFLCGIHLV